MSAYSQLETLDIFLALYVLRGLQAAIVTSAASQLFASAPAWFRCNPANSLLYGAFHALEENCAVHIGELLKAHGGALTLPEELVLDRELVQYRIVLSHPFRAKFNHPDVQAFSDEGKHYGFLRFAPIWHLQSLINKRLAQEGRPIRTPDIPVTHEMALAVHHIYAFALKPECAHVNPDVASLQTTMETFKQKLFDFAIAKRAGRADEDAG